MKIVYERPDGGLSIVSPAPKNHLEKVFGRMTDEQYRTHVYERSIPADAKNVREVTDDEIPQDRHFRNAWKLNGTKIDVDLEKAREIHMNEIRKLRDKKLAELDIETLKGKDVQVQKQILRDLPQKYDLTIAKTPERLKTMIPSILK